MGTADRSSFIYVSFIRTTPAKLWEALTTPEFIRQYWFGLTVKSTWKKGAPWKLYRPDGETLDTDGEILELDPPRRMVLRWQKTGLEAEGPGRCEITLEPAGPAVKLTIAHSIDRAESKLIPSVAFGWPLVVSNLKSFLETGAVALTEF